MYHILVLSFSDDINTYNNTQARSSSNSSNSSTSSSFIQRWLRMVASLLRILLWPVRRLSAWLFPGDEYDGLSPAVTAKATQQFVSYLRGLKSSHVSNNSSSSNNIVSNSSNNNSSVSDAWVTTGFAEARQQALLNNHLHQQQQEGGLLFVYLHSPLHRLADHFALNILCHESMVDFMNQQHHITSFGVSIHTAQGAQLAQMLNACAFPFICLLQPKGPTTMQLLFRAEGPALTELTIDRIMPHLQTALQRHESIVAAEQLRRLQREQEQDLRRQQDEEYQAALLADQERERQQAQERERDMTILREEEERMREEKEDREAALDSARAQVRPEPESGGTTVRFVLPSGMKLNRRFGSDETIGALKAFLKLHFHENEIAIERVALSTNFPRKTFDDEGITLEAAGLSPQAVLMVQDLDA
jgi:FAS-associated factor 2